MLSLYQYGAGVYLILFLAYVILVSAFTASMNTGYFADLTFIKVSCYTEFLGETGITCDQLYHSNQHGCISNEDPVVTQFDVLNTLNIRQYYIIIPWIFILLSTITLLTNIIKKNSSHFTKCTYRDDNGEKRMLRSVIIFWCFSSILKFVLLLASISIYKDVPGKGEFYRTGDFTYVNGTLNGTKTGVPNEQTMLVMNAFMNGFFAFGSVCLLLEMPLFGNPSTEISDEPQETLNSIMVNILPQSSESTTTKVESYKPVSHDDLVRLVRSEHRRWKKKCDIPNKIF